MQVHDLRKALGKIRGYDGVYWNGRSVVCSYRGRLASASVSHHVLPLLRDCPPLIALRAPKCRMPAIELRPADQVLLEMLTEIVLAAWGTVDEILGDVPDHTVRKFLHRVTDDVSLMSEHASDIVGRMKLHALARLSSSTVDHEVAVPDAQD